MSTTYSRIKDGYGEVDGAVKPSDNFTDENFSEIETLPFSLGYIPDEPDSRDYKLSSLITDKKLSDKSIVNYRNEMSPVKNQRSKGSCVGFAVAAMIEWQQQQEYLKEKQEGSAYTRDKDHYDLSEQWIYHKAKEIDGYPDDSGGTTLRAAMKIINKKGVPPEKGWEYSDEEKGEPEFWAYSTAKWNVNKDYYKIETIEEMKKTLRKVGPFVSGVLVFPEWKQPDDDGYVKYPDNLNDHLGGHAICIVGYDDTTERFIFKNSWGKNWGDNGYGQLSYKYMEDLSIISWVSIDKNVSSL